jgi:hypothetical protein
MVSLKKVEECATYDELRDALIASNERVKELEAELTQVRADKGSYTWTKEQYEQLRKEQED